MVVNLCKGDLGNPVTPEKIKRAQKEQVRATRRYRIALATGMLLAALALGGLFWFTSHRAKPEQAVSVSAKSIAVLPFENLSSDKENAYFADGVQDEILADLAKVADLKVISRTSVMPYKTGLARNLRDIGQQLDVAHLLEGSVQRAANKVRVTRSLSMPGATNIFGRRFMIDPWTMSSQSKARSPRRSPISFRRSYLRKNGGPSSRHLR